MKKLNKTFKINPLYESDGYKLGHPSMLADNTKREYWTWIPRNLKYMHESINKIMSAGQQVAVRYIHSHFQENFFDIDKKEAMKFMEDMSLYLGVPYENDYFSDLYDLGYLPIHIQALPEGIFTNANIPQLTGINTNDNFAWLGLYLETLFSKLLWQMPTVATIGEKFKSNAVEWTLKTDKENIALADFMCHDFHSRGGNPFSATVIGLAHSFSNLGTDTLNTIPASRYYYDFPEDQTPVYSVNATEHSVTTTGIFYYKNKLEKGLLNDEIEKYYKSDIPCEGSIEEPDYLAIAELLNLKRLLKKFPTGILSYVSDTFDLWKLITFILPRVKNEVLARDGKLVIRPDSGDPVKIITGSDKINSIIQLNERQTKKLTDEYNDINDFLVDYFKEKISFDDHYDDEETFIVEYENKYYEVICSVGECIEASWDGTIFETDVSVTEAELQMTSADKGVVELLYDVFGGHINDQGYKLLDSHIGVIYGDSINLERQVSIYERLEKKRFAATNVVLGIGSFTYVMMTRDSAGYAAKGAWFEIEEDGIREQFNIFKDPITDDGTKTSLKGFQYVDFVDGEYVNESEVSEEKAYSEDNVLQTIYKDGKFYNQTTIAEIRERIKNK